MGDIVNKLNFNTSNQWIFCDERIPKFFDIFAYNITDSNILTETEILEQEELNSSLLSGTEDDVISLRQSTATRNKLLHGYDELINDMRDIKQIINADFSNLEEQFHLLVIKKGTFYLFASKVKRMEELQSENFEKTTEVAKMFVQIRKERHFRNF
uniref:HAUS-augmin3 domain-containing protein n=1 Tax=Glossina austeni TaxID=7395 RepID=A0A1A9UYS9_GLOAU